MNRETIEKAAMDYVEQHYPYRRRRCNDGHQAAADEALGEHDDGLVDKKQDYAADGRLHYKFSFKQAFSA